MAGNNVLEIKARLDKMQASYAAHVQNYKDWFTNNESIQGTPEYNNYAAQYSEWQKTCLDKINAQNILYNEAFAKSFQNRVIADIPKGPSSAEIDAELRQLIHHVNPKQFMMAIINYGHKDPQFLQDAVITVNNVHLQRTKQQSMETPRSHHALVNGTFFSQAETSNSQMNYRVEPPIKRSSNVIPQKQSSMGNSVPFKDFSHT
uniref:Gag protein n=1 Tax=Rhabditophanes sp. KR3021 TaxID=114890 RepID=A0AC35TVT0_9BILA